MQNFALRGLYAVKFGRVEIVAKKKYHDGTETVPSWKIVGQAPCCCGRGFGLILGVFLPNVFDALRPEIRAGGSRTTEGLQWRMKMGFVVWCGVYIPLCPPSKGDYVRFADDLWQVNVSYGYFPFWALVWARF